ncbi:hypothetical protein [Oceanospirillum beijerinckii]|uniref:hypothetical protein n=1 Tax=Oceanospirillum beijerinckii TaxID=64976 RepID=UPI00041B5729|nr:hypothetical protein [Oceanospirillum beijerinckii]
MESPELLIILLNIVVATAAYSYIYPRFCGSDINKIAINDILASGVSLLVAGAVYWGSGVEFDLIFTTVNWFGFTLITYFILETPLMLWYFKKHKVLEKFNA